MKKLLFLTFTLMAASLGFTQTITVGAPANTGATSTLRAPNGTTAHTTLRGHLIIAASELTGIPSGTTFNGLGFLYSSGVNVAAGGNIQFYLENTADVTNLKSTTWATAISTMTSVYTGAISIPITATTNNVTTTTPFIYTGGGLYVAYDYLGTTFATTAAVYLCNNSIAGGTKMDAAATTTPPAVITQSSSWRPEIQFTYTNPFNNNLAVKGIFPGKGKDNLLLGATQTVLSEIKNLSSVAITNFPVTLTITGANPYTSTQTIPTIASGATIPVNFTGVPKTITGAQTVVVSVPPDQQTSNDSYTLTQNIFCDTVGYTYGNSVTGGLGYDTGAGILANLFVLPAGSPILVTKVIPTIANSAAVANKTIKGVLLNSAGVIVDSTANHIITTAELGQAIQLSFINGATNYSGDSVYIGFRQVASTPGYFPLATQDIAGMTPADLFCGFGANGGTYANYTTFGTFMIGAVLSPINVASNAPNNIACPNASITVNATTGLSTYSFSQNGTTVQSGTNASYTYTQTAGTTTVVQSSIGTCSYSASVTVNQGSATASSISATFCQGTTYMFNSQALTSPGNYIDTVPNFVGCDSIIYLALSYGATSGTNSQTICSGSSYSIGTNTYSTAGSYIDTLLTSSGCDSVVTTNLTVTAPLTSSLQASICAGSSYAFGGQNYTTSGSYTNTVQNAAGCDSVITLNLTVAAAINVTVNQTGAVLTAAATGSMYQWISCPSNIQIPGATSASFQPTDTVGMYAVIVTTGGCSDTSACTTVDQTGMDELDLNSSIRLYPNPSAEVVHVVSNEAKIKSYRVYDMSGRIVVSSELEVSQTSIDIVVDKLQSGSYTVELNTSKGLIGKAFVRK